MTFNAHYVHYLTALTQHGFHYVRRRYERHVAYSKILRPPRGGAWGGGGVLYRRDISVGMCRRDSSTLSLYQT